MISTKQEVQILAALMLQKGITHVVISPGSRNAPLINTFDGLAEFTCYNVVDERSAAFFAMGLALKLKQPVAVACTSGSAILNYASAAAEAFYQKIPLLILSADRPREWIDQGDGQTIRQENALLNVVKKSISLTGGMRDETEIWHNTRLINEGLNALVQPEAGSVHINLPFAEPLYGLTDNILPKVKNISLLGKEISLSEEEIKHLKTQWNEANRKIILVGQMQADAELNQLLCKFSEEKDVVVLSEKTSNIQGEYIIDSIDNVIFHNNDEALSPDLLVTLGGQIVSKKVKAFLRQNKAKNHWHFSPSMDAQDTFMSLTEVIAADATNVLKQMPLSQNTSSDFATKWQSLNAKMAELNLKYAESLDFCDFKVYESIIKALPEGSTLHLSNSTPARYIQLFPMKNVVYQCNRGTSGIDGVMSTASGYALADDGLNLLIIGDLTFFYDSNALWNRHFPSNLKIVLINNGGGDIFRFIPGSSDVPASEKHFAARHSTKAKGLVENFGINYFQASDLNDFEMQLKELLSSDKSGVLEVFTPNEINTQILRDYFKYLNDNI